LTSDFTCSELVLQLVAGIIDNVSAGELDERLAHAQHLNCQSKAFITDFSAPVSRQPIAIIPDGILIQHQAPVETTANSADPGS
jgi:hypothetical protein